MTAAIKPRDILGEPAPTYPMRMSPMRMSPRRHAISVLTNMTAAILLPLGVQARLGGRGARLLPQLGNAS
ncbi:hypothetical protein [Kamptonema formosum]|uniref:hypothetical protein n=1 Tax=Kamptonema formosum TaxID=331992 RepID=UPI0012DF4875|nr:hypothetical protein [Oscillatoria sp. PCC 10802]